MCDVRGGGAWESNHTPSLPTACHPPIHVPLPHPPTSINHPLGRCLPPAPPHPHIHTLEVLFGATSGVSSLKQASTCYNFDRQTRVTKQIATYTQIRNCNHATATMLRPSTGRKIEHPVVTFVTDYSVMDLRIGHITPFPSQVSQ